MNDDFFCHECKDYIEPVIEDQSFSHEFGIEHIYDYLCPHCETRLFSTNVKPKPEFEEPEKDWMDYLMGE